MTDGKQEILVILDVADGAAQVQLPDTSVEVWALTSLPRGVQSGDRVGVTVTGGDVEVELLARVGGLRA